MNCIKIDINICRVCLQSTTGRSIFSDDILEKFRFATLVHVSSSIYYNKLHQWTAIFSVPNNRIQLSIAF